MGFNHRRNVKVALVVMVSVFVPIVVARSAEGVRSVAAVVQVRSRPNVVAPGNGEGTQRSDAAIKARVEKTLRADRALFDSRIIVKSVTHGVVNLSGYAASSNDIVRAFRLTADQPGVRRVFSEIDAQDVVPAPPVAGAVTVPIEAGLSVQHGPFDAEDDVIRRGVTRALNDLDVRENADIHVQVAEGVVWLTGTVPTWQGNTSRVDAARSVTGVRSVINRLRVVAPNVAGR